MVQAGRVACIFTPFILTLGALICVVLVFMSGTVQHSNSLGSHYFLKLDLTNITLTASANLLGGTSSPGNSVLEAALEAAKQSMGMKDYYTIYLRNYCAWNGDDVYAYCSPRQAKFYFDPVDIWGLNSTGYSIDQVLPESFRTGLATYKKLSIAMFYLYSIGLGATAVTIVVGIFAIFSRWGSFVTSFVAAFAALMVVVASVLASIMFPVLKGALREALDDNYGTKTTLGSSIYAITWIAAAFSVASGLFWFLSICCCSGRSPYNPGSKDARRTRAEKTPYTYERVGSPYMGPRDSQAVPLNTLPPQGHMGYSANPNGQRNTQSAYEPFRPQHV